MSICETLRLREGKRIDQRTIMGQVTPVPEPRSSDAQPRSFLVHPEKAQASADALKIIMLHIRGLSLEELLFT